MSPRRGAGEGHIKKITLRSGRRAWRGFLTVGYRDNGTPIRRTVQRRTRQEVVDALIAMRAKYAGEINLVEEARTRLHDLLPRWLKHYEEHSAPKGKTARTYAWGIDHIVAVSPENPFVAKVQPVQLQELINRLPASLSPSSLNICRIVLKSSFAQAQAWRLRPDNPADGLKLPRRDRAEPERRTVTPDEAEQLIEALAGQRLGLAVALTYAVAARPGEIAALRREDINLEAGTLTIRASHNKVGSEVRREEPKSARGVRTLTIPDGLRPWVAQQIARVVNERRAMGADWTAPDEGLLFVRETDGGRLHGWPLWQVSKRTAERIGLGAVGPRVLRRSMLSALARSGVEAKVRAAIGGHTTAITDKHYREVDQAEVNEAMGKVKVKAPALGQRPGQRPDDDTER